MGIATVAALGTLAVGTYSAINSANNQKKALAQQQQSIDKNSPQALSQIAHDQSIQNAKDSFALEQQLTPEVQPLRTAANNSLLTYMNQGPDAGVTKAQGLISQNLGVPLNTPLLNSAIAKAQSDLALGGRLGSDQQNEATRQGASQAGSVGQGLGLGRDLTARDLGLTSASVEQQRLMNASQLGGQELSKEQAGQSNLLNSLQALQSVNNSRYQQLLGTAQYAQSIRPPVVGLDPGSAAGAQIAQSNGQMQLAQNQANANTAQGNTYANLAGQGLGLLQNWYNKPQFTQTATVGNSSSPYAMDVTYAPTK